MHSQFFLHHCHVHLHINHIPAGDWIAAASVFPGLVVNVIFVTLRWLQLTLYKVCHCTGVAERLTQLIEDKITAFLTAHVKGKGHR